MKISVAICTWNRARLLAQTLGQMRKLQIPKNVEWELVVVNNNSTDNTEEVLERHSTGLPLRRFIEKKQGLSNARNCALSKVDCDLLIWTDDDVLVPENWIIEYVRAREAYPDATFFGGPVLPLWERRPPRWIQRNINRLGVLWALKDLGNAVRPMTATEGVHGANMAFCRWVTTQYAFNPLLGNIGNDLIGGDESQLVYELKQAGHWGVWVGTAPVQHFVSEKRINSNYIWNIIQAQARRSPMAKEDYSHCPAILGHPRWILVKYWKARIRSALQFPFRNNNWLRSFMEAAELSGILRALHHRRAQSIKCVSFEQNTK